MELKVWVDGIPRVVCGLSQETSCQDVVIALAQAIGQTGRYVLIQKLRDKERQLVANERPLESLAKLGQLGNEVQFILRRTGPTSSDASDKGRVPLLPPNPEPSKRKEPKKAHTFTLGPSASSQTHVKWFEKPARDSPRVSPSPTSSLSQDDPSKEAFYQQILRQQAELQALQGQLVGVERELGIWERSPPPTLSPDLLQQMDHIQQAIRKSEAELDHLPYWEKEFHSEDQREKDMLKQKNELNTAIGKESRRQHDIETLSEQLERDIQLLIESKRNGMHEASLSIEESVTMAKRQLDNVQRQGVEMHTSTEETEKLLRQTDEQLLAKTNELDDLNKELRQCNLQQFIQQTGVTPAQSNQQLDDIDDFALLKPDGQSDEDSNSSILEFNPRTTAKQILGNPRSLQNPLVSSLHPEVLSSRETSWH